MSDTQASTSKLDKHRPARTYHFSAEMAAAPGARSSGVGILEWDLLSRGLGPVRQSTSTDRVDLDLSFDFVSQGGEGSMATNGRSLDSLASHASVVSKPEPLLTGSVDSVSPARRRGMSDAMAVASSTRKRPPKPLSFFKKPTEPKSVFSPCSDSETDSPLPVTPLSATRRGQASKLSSSSSLASRRERSNSLVGTQPPSDPPSTPLPPLPTSATSVTSASGSSSSLVQEQRRQRALEQLQSRKDRDSYVPLVPTITLPTAGPSTSPTAFRAAGKDLKTPLDQTFPTTEPAAPKKTRTKPAHSEKLAGLNRLLHKSSTTKLAPPKSLSANALALEHGLISPTPPNPNDTRTPRSMVKSPQVAADELPSFGSQSFGLNILGLTDKERMLESSSPGLPELTDSGSSPGTAGLSTPETFSSSVFEHSPSLPGSEYSRATSHESVRHVGSKKSLRMAGSLESVMPRAHRTAVTDVIQEEPSEEKRLSSTGLPRSETAEWIRQQHEESQQFRIRQETSSSYESTASGPSVHPLIVDTTSSVDTARETAGQLTESPGLGPWPQSPLLLQSHSQMSKESDSGVGLGLFFEPQSSKASLTAEPSSLKAAPRSSIVVGRHEVSHPAFSLPERPPQAFLSKTAHRASTGDFPSPTSSIDEGFSVNVTQPRVSPMAANGKRDQTRSLLGNRFFSSGQHAKEPDEEPLRSPTMKTLTLVDRQGQETLRRHSLAVTGAAFASSMAAQDGGAASAHPSSMVAPNTAPLPQEPAFPATTAIPTSFERSKRSSKHVRRVSRLQYIPTRGAGEVHVTISDEGGLEPRQPSKRFSIIGSGAAAESDRLAALASFKSPRPAPSPSGETPDMLYGHPRARFSWGYAPRTASTGTVKHLDTPQVVHQEQQEPGTPMTPHSPWQDFEPDGRGLRLTRERFESLTQPQSSAGAGEGAALPSSPAVDAMVEGEPDGGLRRRSTLDRRGHQSTASVPPTATIQPFTWKNRFGGNTKRSSVHLDIVAGESGAKIGEVKEEKPALRRLRLQGDLPAAEEAAETRPMSIFVPLAALQSHLRQRNIEERQKRIMAAGGPVAVNVHAQGTEQQPKSMLAAGSHLLYSSGRLLDTELTSKTLFFAGFLGMPWLWLIGGWWLANDGLMLTPGAQQVQFYTHEASMRDAKEADEWSYRERHESKRGVSFLGEPRRAGAEERLSTIYSVEEGYTSRDADATREHEAMPTLYEAPTSASGPFSSGTMHTAASGATLSYGSHSPSTSASASPSLGASTPRTLLAHSAEKLPHQVRKSMSSLLNPHPAVALFHSPVRSVPTSMSQEHDLSADDSGVDILDGHMHKRQSSVRKMMEVVEGRPAEDEMAVMPVARTQMHRPSALERLASTERFVLMNRFMAVVSTVAVFAGFGVALNAVAMNF